MASIEADESAARIPDQELEPGCRNAILGFYLGWVSALICFLILGLLVYLRLGEMQHHVSLIELLLTTLSGFCNHPVVGGIMLLLLAGYSWLFKKIRNAQDGTTKNSFIAMGICGLLGLIISIVWHGIGLALWSLRIT